MTIYNSIESTILEKIRKSWCENTQEKFQATSLFDSYLVPLEYYIIYSYAEGLKLEPEEINYIISKSDFTRVDKNKETVIYKCLDTYGQYSSIKDNFLDILKKTDLTHTNEYNQTPLTHYIYHLLSESTPIESQHEEYIISNSNVQDSLEWLLKTRANSTFNIADLFLKHPLLKQKITITEDLIDTIKETLQSPYCNALYKQSANTLIAYYEQQELSNTQSSIIATKNKNRQSL